MQTVASIQPQPGQSYTETLLYQSGLTEIVNDTNYLIYITLNNGTIQLIPGEAQIYPTPVGGGTVSISVGPFSTVGYEGYSYLNADGGYANNITINQYLDGEISGLNYPFFITRATRETNPLFPIWNSGFQASSASALTVTLTPAFVNQFIYIEGYDFYMGKDGSAHSVTVFVAGCGTFNGGTEQNVSIFNFYESSTTAAIIDHVRFPYGLRNFSHDLDISVEMTAVSGGTAPVSITAFGRTA